MFLIFFIYNMCLLAFYFTFANMIFFDSVISLRLEMYFLILVSISLTYIIKNDKKYSKLKYLPFIGFIVAILLSRTVAGGIFVIIPFIYTIYLVSNNKNNSKFKYLLSFVFIIAILFSRNIFEVIIILIPFIFVIFLVIGKNKHYEDYYSFRDLLIKLLLASAFLLIFTFLNKKFESFYKTGLLYTIIFIISGLYLLLTMRHCEDIIADKKFLSMNLIMIITIFIIAILFSTDVVVNFVLFSLKFIYIKTIIPIIVQVFNIIFTPLGKFIDKTIVSKYQVMFEVSEDKEVAEKENVEQGDITIFYVLTAILVSVAFIFLMYILIKRIMNQKIKIKSPKIKDGIVEYTSFINDDIIKKESKHNFIKTDQTRYWYKKFLELCFKKKMKIFAYDSSQTIYNKSTEVFKNHDEDLKNIKEIYRKARYDNDVVDKQNIKAIKASYKSLEKGK